jgi:hypothetical protein
MTELDNICEFSEFAIPTRLRDARSIAKREPLVGEGRNHSLKLFEHLDPAWAEVQARSLELRDSL